MDAAGNKQGAAGAGAVDNIYRVVLMVIHCFLFSFADVAALAALARVTYSSKLPGTYSFAALLQRQLI